ncbi:MAG: ABC-F family ATP-binding cassette domain-containing protein [Acidimicrobiales bacterium]
MSISVSELEFAHPGAHPLFFDVSFSVSPGEHGAIIGSNGSGKTTLLKILARELEADCGNWSLGGTALYMPQDVGMAADLSVRQMLTQLTPPQVRAAGRRLLAAERAVADGAPEAGIELATAIADWMDIGGYEHEQRWNAAADRVVKSDIDDLGDRPAADLSGGERKRLVLDVLLNSEADILLLDEPDNYLDIPARMWLEAELAASRKTILMVSHDRTVLAKAATKIITLEGSSCWVMSGGFGSYRAERERRQAALGDELQRWKDEERRLFRHVKIMKQRAAISDGNASKANAAETRWKRFVDAGPPPPPVPDQRVRVQLRGADSARRVIKLTDLGIEPLFEPFSDEVYFGERIGLIGSNGTGKSHLLDLLFDPTVEYAGEVGFGPRTSVGRFTQVNDRQDFAAETPLAIMIERIGELERSMKALSRYGLAQAARQPFETLSGGQRARLEILCLDIEGHNVLLLDEPTDNLDAESSMALEEALDSFEGTVVAVSHDRTFLEKMTRFLLIADDGSVFDIPDFEMAIAALTNPDDVHDIKRAKLLS